jgi:hypothetical protein
MLQINNIKIKLFDKIISRAWLELYQSLKVNPDRIIPNLPISDEEFAEKIKKANDLFGFDWPLIPDTQEKYNQMHKDIETASEKTAGLLQNIHHDLHVKEAGNNATHIQVVWSESLGQFYRKKPTGVAMPPDAEPFEKELRRGDVYLGFPHVGKSPEVCMLHHDNSNLVQTCRLHDRITCDLLISITDQTCETDEKLILWHEENKITMFTKQQMLKYNGWAKIGEVINKNDIDNMVWSDPKISYVENQ